MPLARLIEKGMICVASAQSTDARTRVASAGFGFVTFDGPGPAEEVCKRQDHIINGKAVCVPVWCRGGVVWFCYTLPTASPVYRACRLGVSPLALVSLFSSAGCLLRRLSPGNEVWQVEIKSFMPKFRQEKLPLELPSQQPMAAAVMH